MKVFVSTVGRGKDKEESSKVYKIDLNTGDILASVRLPLAMFDLANPRGGCRGARGLCIHKGELWAAGFDGLFNLDKETLFIKKGFWSEDFKDIHQIYSCNSTNLIIGTATWTNQIFLFETINGEFLFHKDLTEVFEGIPNPLSPDRMHLNALSEDLGLLCRLGKIVDWRREVVVYEGLTPGSHDLVLLPTGEVVVNISREATTLAIDLQQKTQRVIHKVDRNPSKNSELALHGWVRGMSYLSDTDQLLVGCSPAEILVIDKVSSSPYLSKTIKITDEIVESVFDVIVEE